MNMCLRFKVGEKGKYTQHLIEKHEDIVLKKKKTFAMSYCRQEYDCL